MPLPNFHVRHLVESSAYEDFRTQVTTHKGKDVHVLWATPKAGGRRRPVSIRYPKDKWDAAAARAASSGGRFEPAKGE